MSAAAGPRGRYREQVRTEIKELAWAQVASLGASGLSLNAIAKQMGISGPALYRYYAGRDELITELVLEAYRDLAVTVRAAARAAAAAAAVDRVLALGRAIRAWALADPHRYLLIYGTPVPGYHAPEEATVVAREILAVLLELLSGVDPAPGTGAAAALERNLESLGWAAPNSPSPATLRLAFAFWTRTHGVLGLELAGHFAGSGMDPALLFDAELAALLAPAGSADGCSADG